MSFISGIYQNALKGVMEDSLKTNQGIGTQLDLQNKLATLSNLEQFMSPMDLMRARAGAMNDVNQDLSRDKVRTMKGKAPQYVTSLPGVGGCPCP